MQEMQLRASCGGRGTQENFGIFYQAVVTESRNLTAEPTLPRQRQVPKCIDQGAQSHQYQSPEAYFRQQYFEVLDILITELGRRFDQESLKLLSEAERMLINACNGSIVQPSDWLQELYQADIDFQRLSMQLAMLPDLVKAVNQQNHSQVIRGYKH